MPWFFVLAILLAPPTGVLAAEPFDEETARDALERARAYIRNLYVPTVGLASEGASGELSTIFWLNDAVFAIEALRASPHEADRVLAAEMTGRVLQWAAELKLEAHPDGFPRLRLHEVVAGYPLTLPFRCGADASRALEGPNLLRATVFNGTRFRAAEEIAPCFLEDWWGYADLVLYAALSAHGAGNDTEARILFRQAARFWDGTGIADNPFLLHRDDQHAKYATYKVALLLLVAHRFYNESDLRIEVPFHDEVVSTLWGLQTPDGGVVTNYAGPGIPAGNTNLETTALFALAEPRLLPPLEPTTAPPRPFRPDAADVMVGLLALLVVLNAAILLRLRGKGGRGR